MSKTFYARAAAVLSLVGALGLSGCAGIGTIPDTNMPGEQITPAPVQGQVLGGHAPIVGAHVYVLQPGTSGIGSQATSHLTPGYSAGGVTVSTGNSDPSVNSGWGYVTTDSTGSFNITGAYSCTANQPVYLYAYGGTPSTTNETFPITQVVVTEPSSGVSQMTFTTSGNELFYAGELVYPTGFTGALAGLDGTAQVIDTPANTPGAVLTTTTFTVTYTRPLTAKTYTTADFGTSAVVTGAPQYNNGLVQLAVLGNCPSSAPYTFGTGSSDQLTYVYMNEVSTVAMAYAFQGFTKPSLNNATQIGSSGSAQGLIGIENAALTAGELYNIQGGTNISSSYDGEGHLANTVTNNGNGIVPQTVLDTLGNILAACVDSAPNVTGSAGSNPTVQCSTLFNTATSDGTTTGTKAVDTATAAINIARHPAGVGNTSFMSTLYGLPSGNVPFVPNLTAQPNDFTVGIQYTAASGNYGISNAESIAIDGNGYVWVTAQNLNNPGNYSFFLWDSQGVTPPLATRLNHFPKTTNSYVFGYVSIDPANNAWTGPASVTNSIQEFSSGTSSSPGSAVITTSQTYTGSYAVVTSYSGGSLGNVFSFSQPPGGATCTGGHTFCLNVLTPTGAVSTGSPYSMANFGSNNVSHASIGSDGYLWATSEGNGHIDRISQTGAEAPVFTLVSTGSRPEFAAIDANNNAIVPIQRNSTVDAVSVNGYVTTLTGGAYNATTNPLGTGARFFQPFGSAVDGNGNIWITNRCNGNEEYNAANYPTCTLITPTGGNTGSIVQSNGSSSLMELTPTYTLGTTITSATAVSPAANYNPENEITTFSGSTPTTTIYPLLFDPLNLAIDPSGNIWITNFGNGSAGGTASVNGWVTELVGMAAPVVTPLSTAAGLGKLGATP